TGGEMGAGGGAQHQLLVRRDATNPRAHLDDTRPHAGFADALSDLPHEGLGHLGERVAELLAELEVRRGAEVLLVESGGADDADPALLRDLCHELDIATEVDGTRIDERTHAEVVQLGEAIDAAPAVLAAGGAIERRVRLPAGPPDQQVLV